MNVFNLQGLKGSNAELSAGPNAWHSQRLVAAWLACHSAIKVSNCQTFAVYEGLETRDHNNVYGPEFRDLY